MSTQDIMSVIPNHTLHVWRDVYKDELGWFHQEAQVTLEDGYEMRSVYLLAYLADRKEPIGTARLVFPMLGRLPVESSVSLGELLEPFPTRVEMTRLMVKSAYRKVSVSGYPFGVYRSLMKTVLHWCKSSRFRGLILNVRARGEPLSIIRSLDVYGAHDLNVVIIDEFDASSPLCTPIVIDVDSFFNSEPSSALISYTQAPMSADETQVVMFDHHFQSLSF